MAAVTMLGCAHGGMDRTPQESGRASREVSRRLAAEEAALARIIVSLKVAESQKEAVERAVRGTECRARALKLDADAATLSARCSKQHAEAFQCLANVAKEQADSTLLGCLFGIGAAILTGGAGAPVALLGCAGGRLLADSESICAVPACDPSDRAAWQTMLAQHELSAGPMCGREVGAQFASSSVEGVAIEDLGPGTSGQRLGLRPGDILLRLGERSIQGAESWHAELGAIVSGSAIDLVVSRDGVLTHLRGVQGDDAMQLQLGDPVPVESGMIEVVAVEAKAPADRAGLRVHDVITSVDAVPLLDVEQIRRAVLIQAEGERVRLGFERDGQIAHVDLGFAEMDEDHARESAQRHGEQVNDIDREVVAAAPHQGFGDAEVPNGRQFSLRMNGIIDGLEGQAREDGFTLRILDRQALDRASPIARAHPAVARAMLLNRGDFAELTVDFVPGMAPRYRVIGSQDTLQITIERL